VTANKILIRIMEYVTLFWDNLSSMFPYEEILNTPRILTILRKIGKALTLTIIVCLVGIHFRRPLDGVRYWSKRKGITRLYLLYSDKSSGDETKVFTYMSNRNALELKERLEILDPIVIGFDPMDYKDTFRKIYSVVSKAKEEVLIDITSTTNVAEGAALTIALMFRNARVYSVPASHPAWYVTGQPDDPEFQRWFESSRNVSSSEPLEIKLPGYRLEPHGDRENKIWDMERRLLVILRGHGGQTDSISEIIEWFGYRNPNSTLRNRFSRIVTRLEEKGLVEGMAGAKLKGVRLTEFGEIFAEALAEEGLR